MADDVHITPPRTENITAENITKLAALFPTIATEVQDAQTGEAKQAIDFDALKALLGDVAEGTRERYQFTWPGKSAAQALAMTPTEQTLHPEPERSKDWDTTHNLYIEGDNLEALKILRSTYAGKVKLIYIDPPYNTGHDFVYKDDFTADADAYKKASGEYDENGGRLVANPETSGRFHSDWCSMIYPRLLLARDFLTPDGAIFISIDDNEQANLKKICDEVFGASNFIAQLVWQRAYSPKNDARFVSNSHDYVLMYSRDISKFTIGRLPRTAEANSRYQNPDNDPRGPWMSDNLSVKTYDPNNDYPITTPSGRVVEALGEGLRRATPRRKNLVRPRREQHPAHQEVPFGIEIRRHGAAIDSALFRSGPQPGGFPGNLETHGRRLFRRPQARALASAHPPSGQRQGRFPHHGLLLGFRDHRARSDENER